MLQFSGILINLSVRHTPRVPVWFATQQLVAANSTISNPNPEPDPTPSSTATVHFIYFFYFSISTFPYTFT